MIFVQVHVEQSGYCTIRAVQMDQPTIRLFISWVYFLLRSRSKQRLCISKSLSVLLDLFYSRIQLKQNY